MPRPPVVRSRVRSTWLNMSKMVGSDSAGMPIPVSRTVTTTSPPSRRAESQIFPPDSVYFEAFVRRLLNTWARRVRSALR